MIFKICDSKRIKRSLPAKFGDHINKQIFELLILIVLLRSEKLMHINFIL